jgi:hypothetical protein
MNTYYVIDIFVDDKLYDSYGEHNDLQSANEQLAELKTEDPDWDFRIRKVTEEYI